MAPSPQAGLAAALKTKEAAKALAAFSGNAKTIREEFKRIVVNQAELKGGGVVTFAITDPARTFDVAVALQEMMWPEQTIFSIVSLGLGKATQIQDQASCGLELIPKEGCFNFQIHGKTKSETLLAQEAANLHATIVKEWTPNRARAVRKYRQLGRQIDVASNMGVSQQAVSQMLTGARYRRLVTTEAVIRNWLSEPPAPGIWPLRRKQS